MVLVDSFLAWLLQLGASLSTPSLHTLTLIVSGWLMARRRTLSHMLLAFCPNCLFSLPILFRLYRSQKAVGCKRRAHRTRPELLVELLHLLCARYPHRRFHLYVDSAYGGQSVLAHLPANCDLTSRLPLDARLYTAHPERKPGTRGRPRKRGEPMPSPEQMLGQRGRRLTLEIYGRKDKSRVVETVAYWYSVPSRPLRVVAVEPLTGGRPPQAFYSTAITQSAEQVLVGYSGRWSIEEAIQGSKSHLGFEEPQSWSPKAVQRTAPMAMLLYSLVVLWFAKGGHVFYRPPERPWFPEKTRPSFADMLDTLRKVCLEHLISANLRKPEGLQNPLDPMQYILQAAA